MAEMQICRLRIGFGCCNLTARKERTHAITATRGRCDDAEIFARQIRDRRGRRDDLYERLEQDDPGARHLGRAQRDPRRRAEGRRHRRHARLFGRRLDQRHLHLRRSRHPPQFLHGRGRRRLLDRGAGRHRDRADRGRLLQDRRDLPLDERLHPGPHRRHRGALGGAGRRRHAAQPRLWLAERRTELCADLYAPYVRLRHDAGAGRACEDVPQQARLEQPEGLLQEALHGRGRHQQPLHLQAAAPVGLLRRNR